MALCLMYWHQRILPLDGDSVADVAGPATTVDAMQNVLQSMRTSCLSTTTDKEEIQWDERFYDLIRYKQTFGNCDVPRDFPEFPQLASWVNRQRRVYSAGNMTTERIERLESVGFTWRVRAFRSNKRKKATKK